MTKKINKRWHFICGLALSVSIGMTSNLHAREMTEYPRVKLQSLDKVTAHTMTFEANVGNTLKFGPLYMKVQSCQKSSPIDDPESAAFIQVWEGETDDTSKWVFSGWMFASSPGLSAMDHPIYDVWVIDCMDADKDSEEDKNQSDNLEIKDRTNQPDQGDTLE